MLTSIYFFILIELVVVTYADLIYRKIKNQWGLLNIIIFLIFFFLFPSFYRFEFAQFSYSLAFFIVGFFLFILRVMGGGDSKYLASLFLLVPMNLQDQFLLVLLYSTIFVGILALISNAFTQRISLLNAIKTKDVLLVRKIFGDKFTYAPVILLAWIWMGWDIIVVVVSKN